MNSAIDLQQKTALIHESVPTKGITCSNRERVLRLAKNLNIRRKIESSWGTFVVIGESELIDSEIFIALAPIGSGSGLVFTELYYQGANFIVRYGSDDVPQPTEAEKKLVKIIDEADNLYGYSKAIGIASSLWGKSIPASSQLVAQLKQAVTARHLSYEVRLCHHLEAYHALRNPQLAFAKRGLPLDRIAVSGEACRINAWGDPRRQALGNFSTIN
ncbi:MAG: hypothetical protein QNJ34_16180 [Xenococcaceae cyanobacterium MO_188.B29]|nr:hypothetical protein [Xenococcaceae cyanobacterium MO_188.B29]